jgi:protein-S-isoprenylcysteine O-methyltransferase Ste14
MNPWIAKATILLASVVMIAIRAPHGQRSRTVKIRRNLRGRLETVLLAFAILSFFLPLAWVATPWLAFADYPLHLFLFAAGCACYASGLWFFHLSHKDLGTNWSVTLQVRENHRLVTQGIYTRVRHPMYLGLFLYSLGQALVLPNWLAGPSYLVTFGLLFLLRVGREERMMREEFGSEYEAYTARTARLVPGIY